MSAPAPGGRILVTGGAGFIGSCFVRDLMARRDGTRVTVLDKLTYAGNLENLAPVRDDPEQAARFTFEHGDIADPATVGPLVAGADAVVNFAAESHVDRSIHDPAAFLRTGVDGVHVLLEAVRVESARAAAGERAPAPRYLQVSTDEVYGSVEEGFSREGDPLAPRSPYAAAKAAGELLARSYHVTYGIDVVITRGSNTYGPYHHPEKLIPLFVTNALDDLPLPLYGDGLQVRDWIHVADHAGAIDFVLRNGRPGETYNIPGSHHVTNREIVTRLLDRLGKPWSLVRTVADRPGHDRRYAMAGDRLAALGWSNRVAFEEGIAATVDWYRDHESWWRAVKAGDWNTWYARQYADRLAGSTAAAPEATAPEAAGPQRAALPDAPAPDAPAPDAPAPDAPAPEAPAPDAPAPEAPAPEAPLAAQVAGSPVADASGGAAAALSPDGFDGPSADAAGA